MASFVAVVRNSERLQPSAIDRHSGAAHAEAHQILPPTESSAEENRRCQPEERPRGNGETF